MSTGKWAEPGVPHKGWTCVGVDDLEDDRETCEMCEAQEIRYVHHMEHPDYQGTLRCGCVCAGHMEEDLAGARDREKHAARKSRWLKRRWYRQYSDWPDIQPTGLEYINTDRYHISVYPRHHAQGWGFSITNQDTGRKIVARQHYPSLDAAKLRSFDAMAWMKERAG